MKKKKVLLLVSGLVLIPLMSVWLFSFDDETNEEKKVDQRSTIAMYVEGEDGEYSQSNERTFPKEGYVLNVEKSCCINGGSISQDSRTKVISLSAVNADSCTLYFDKEKAPSTETTLAILNIKSNGIKNDFDTIAATDEGVFEMEDDYGTSYYYRGAVTNNYVKFAGFYWRIIRVNGDGSLRIIYDGTQAYENGTNNGDRFIKTGQPYNSNYNDNKYLGWMYGPVGTTASTSKEQAQTNIADSDVKKVVDAWYKTNIEDAGYGNAVSDTLFCNDRSIPEKEAAGWSYDAGLGYGTNATIYGAFARMRVGFSDSEYSGATPTFKCPQKNDAFTVNDTTKGNGALTYPVGLITADEVVTAGSGKYFTNNTSYYLYRGISFWYWLLSPYSFSNNTLIFILHASGQLSYTNGNHPSGSIAPVINLSAKYVKTLSGTGTMTDPYQAL